MQLAGALLGFLALQATNIGLKHKSLTIFCDNTKAFTWAYTLRNSNSTCAGQLLRYLGLTIHKKQASCLIPHHITGDDNLMTVVISRTFKTSKYVEASNISSRILIPIFHSNRTYRGSNALF